MERDAFDQFKPLLHQGRGQDVISRLVGEDGRIRREFRVDTNHAWYLAGNTAYDLDDVDRALKYFKNAVKSWPEDTQALMLIANCYSDLCKPHWSARYLAKALALDRKNTDLIYNLGNAYYDMRRYAEAAKHYRKVIKHGTGETRALAVANLAHALAKLHPRKRKRKEVGEAR